VSLTSPGLHALLALGISHGSCASQFRLSLDGGVGTGTWCPRPSQASPSRPTSLSALFGAEFKERCAHNAKIVLRAMKRQAERDVRVETAKGTISSIIDLDSLFDEMDRRHKGYVTDTDLWSFVRDLGGSTPLHHITALISEVQLRIGRGRIVTPGHLSKRDLCILLFPIHSSLYKAAWESRGDSDLHLKLRRQEPKVSHRARYQLQYFFDVAATCAHELDSDREQLAVLAYDLNGALNDAFTFLSRGRESFSEAVLREACVHDGLVDSSQEMVMLWRRYQPLPYRCEVSFTEFVRQLKPRWLL